MHESWILFILNVKKKCGWCILQYCDIAISRYWLLIIDYWLLIYAFRTNYIIASYCFIRTTNNSRHSYDVWDLCSIRIRGRIKRRESVWRVLCSPKVQCTIPSHKQRANEWKRQGSSNSRRQCSWEFLLIIAGGAMLSVDEIVPGSKEGLFPLLCTADKECW